MMNSAFEGFPMVLVEAQQTGVVPVIYDSFKSAFDIIDDGQNGYIVPYQNEVLFIERMILLMNNDKLRQKMAQNGKIEIEKFSVEAITAKWIALFRNL